MLLSNFILGVSLIAAGSAQVEYFGTSNVRNQGPGSNQYTSTINNRPPYIPPYQSLPSLGTPNSAKPKALQANSALVPYKDSEPGSVLAPDPETEPENYPIPIEAEPDTTIFEPDFADYSESVRPSLPEQEYPWSAADTAPGFYPQPGFNPQPGNTPVPEPGYFNEPVNSPDPEPGYYPQPGFNPQPGNTLVPEPGYSPEPVNTPGPEPGYYPDPANTAVPEPGYYPDPVTEPDFISSSTNTPVSEPSYYSPSVYTPIPDPGYSPQPGNTPASEPGYDPEPGYTTIPEPGYYTKPGNTPDPEPGYFTEPQPEPTLGPSTEGTTPIPVRPSNDPEWPNNRPISGEYLPNFNCTNGNGFYPVPNHCDTYVECRGYVAYKLSCPDGLHFKALVRPNEYPCAYPSESKCPEGFEKQPPYPTDLCPRQYGFFSMSDGECSKYIMCDTGIATIMDCPRGLVFNEKTSSCDWPENVPMCNSNAFKDFQCPEGPMFRTGWMSDIIYKYKYGNQCKLYIACQRGYPRLLSCNPGLLFDENLQTCKAEEYVNCSG